MLLKSTGIAGLGLIVGTAGFLWLSAGESVFVAKALAFASSCL